MRFGFLLKRGKPEAAELGAELGQVLRRRSCKIVVVEEDGPRLPGAEVVPADALGAAVDALVVLGGDGTFLHAARLVADQGVPLFGVNLGSLGFLTHYTRSQAAEALEAAYAGTLPIDERMRIEVTFRSANGESVERRTAVNDAVIGQLAMARLLDLQARIGDEVITTYKADGLILATPTGSTAYSLAAGGPIVTPDLQAIVVSPICPHTVANRPLVVRADSRLTVTILSPRGAHLTVDGQWGRELGMGDIVEVQKTSRPLRIYRGSASFFTILRGKLSWGERHG
jgi:NAD+ kinase